MKIGDTVLVYGTVVNWRVEKKFFDKAEYWFLRGRKAKILDVVNKDEFTVRFLGKDQLRPLKGLLFEVHAKQCRRVK